MKRVLAVLARAPEAISCRLSSADLVERADAWRTVRDGLELVDRRRFEGGFSIVLRGDEGRLDEVSRLVAAERQCCDWARWDFEREPGLATLTVSGDEELVAPLASAFLRADDENVTDSAIQRGRSGAAGRTRRRGAARRRG